MAHDVFISYSSKDKSVADGVCATLEGRKIRCWIAPRDVPLGMAYGAALVQAIGASRVLVLLLSQGSNASDQVIRELEIAVDSGIPIIPLRIEDIEPTDAMRYYIKSLHWLDAMSPPLERHLGKLAASVQAILSVGEDLKEVVAAPVVAPAPPTAKRPPLPVWAMGLIGLAAVVIIAGGVWWVASLRIPVEGVNPSAVSAATEVAAATDVPSTESPPTTQAESPTEEVTFEIDEGWQALSFLFPNTRLWQDSGDGVYTAVDQRDLDAFAWSTETVEGDLRLRFNLQSPTADAVGCAILYGGGHEHSTGSLIFCLEPEFFTLEKDTRFHAGENFLTVMPGSLGFSGDVYAVEIEVIGEDASMFVNGLKVLTAWIDPEEFERRGRIGLYKAWVGPEVRFSNIRMTIPEAGEIEPIAAAEDGECELDHGVPMYFYPMESPFSLGEIQVDGMITSEQEWAQAGCVDLRMHYGIYADNPNVQYIRTWVQNNASEIAFLVRIPMDLAVSGAFVDHFWPEYIGAWEHSDGAYVNVEDELFDQGNWDDLQWHQDEDMDPPGTFDLQAMHSSDGEYYWFEILRPLNSGDVNDWVLEPGGTYGNNPLDTFMIGVAMEEGDYIRDLQLTLGQP